MNSYFMMIVAVLLAVLGTTMAKAHGVAVAAPVVAAPAAIGYARAIPYNIPPYASRVDINTKALAAPFLAPAPIIAAHAAPVVAAHAAPVVAAHAAPVVAAHSAPVVAAHAAPVVAAHAAPFVAAHASPLTYGAFPAPFVNGPGLVHSTYAGNLVAPWAAAVAPHSSNLVHSAYAGNFGAPLPHGAVAAYGPTVVA